MQNITLRRFRNDWPLVMLALAAILPLFVVRFLPVFDYPHWVYQAHVIAHYADFRRWYTLSWTPAPNLGSTIPLLVLAPLFGAEPGTKMVVALYAGSMVLAFAYVVRGIARAPTGTELLGSLLVYNYFFYNGFLSYIVGFPVLLATLGVLVRPSELSWKKRTILTILSTIAYLCHLFVWLPIVLYLLIAVFVTRTRKPILLLSQIIPLVLLIVYTIHKENDISTLYYTSLPDKFFSVFGPILPYQRVDPFASPTPILFLNTLTISVVTLFLVRIYRARSLSHAERSLLYLCAGLIVAAIVLPFKWFSGMGAVDQRFAFTAYVVLLAGLGAAKATRPRWPLAMLFSLVLLAAHTINFISFDDQLRAIHTAIQVRPQNASVFAASLRHPPLYGECTPSQLLNAGNGIFALQWFALYDAVERGGVAASSFSTAALHSNDDAVYPMMFGQFQTEQERSTFVSDSAGMSHTYDYLFLFGCPEDIHSVEGGLRSRFDLVDRGAYYAIMRSMP